MSSDSENRPQLSLERRELLELLLREMGEDTSRLPIIPRRRDRGVFPLSFAQQRLWFLDQLEPECTAYIVPMALRIEGELDICALDRSLSLLVQRHESLRTRFEEQANQPVQVIEAHGTFAMISIDLCALEPV